MLYCLFTMSLDDCGSQRAILINLAKTIIANYCNMNYHKYERSHYYNDKILYNKAYNDKILYNKLNKTISVAHRISHFLLHIVIYSYLCHSKFYIDVCFFYKSWKISIMLNDNQCTILRNLTKTYELYPIRINTIFNEYAH